MKRFGILLLLVLPLLVGPAAAQEAPLPDRPLFAIGSTTKAFTAAGLGLLHDEGRLDGSTPVREYLPRSTMPNAFGRTR